MFDQRTCALTKEVFRGQHVIERHKQTAAHQDGDQRYENIGQYLNSTGQGVALRLGGYRLELFGGHLAVAGDFSELVVDNIDVTRADDDLEHPAGLKCSLEIGVVIKGLLVDFLFVVENKPHSCRTVRGCLDIRFPT